MKKNLLEIQNLRVAIGGKEILKGVSLTVGPGEVVAVMGPNGSGKSTLAYSLMGHPGYKTQNSKLKTQIRLGEKNILPLSTEERARAGLFLALQSPMAIPGVSVVNLLRTAYQTIYGKSAKQLEKNPVQNPLLSRRFLGNGLSLSQFTAKLKDCARFLEINDTFLMRGVHDGFSGGEKKKIEMLQALVLQPKFAIFDEIDTGLDVDALKLVARGIKRLTEGGAGVIVITHYQRILKYLKPDVVHVLVDGKIVKSGKATLAKKIEQRGYKEYLVN